MWPQAEVQLVVLAPGIEADVNMWEMATNTGFGEEVLNYCYFPTHLFWQCWAANWSSDALFLRASKLK